MQPNPSGETVIPERPSGRNGIDWCVIPLYQQDCHVEQEFIPPSIILAGAKSRVFASLINGTANDGGRAADVANDGQNIVLFDQLPNIRRGASRFVAVIERNQPQLATIYASVTVCPVEAGQDSPFARCRSRQYTFRGQFRLTPLRPGRRDFRARGKERKLSAYFPSAGEISMLGEVQGTLRPKRKGQENLAQPRLCLCLATFTRPERVRPGHRS